MRPLHLDLFTGIAGATLAAEACGWETAAFSEILPWKNSILKYHWPEVPNLQDIRTITRQSLSDVGVGEIDLITGGVPCSPSSLAGRRRGTSDERWLWDEYQRVVGDIAPRWVLAENPPGIASLEEGKAFNRIISGISSLGYVVGWVRFPASAVGAPHLRQRIFIIGFKHTVADDNSLGWGWGSGEQRTRRGLEPTDGSEGRRENKSLAVMADDNREGLEKRKVLSPHSAEIGKTAQRGHDHCGERPVESRMVRGVHWFPGGILNHSWPAGKGEPQLPGEPPRVKSCAANRKNKIHALGDAVVPQQQYMVLKAIWSMDPLKAGL